MCSIIPHSLATKCLEVLDSRLLFCIEIVDANGLVVNVVFEMVVLDGDVSSARFEGFGHGELSSALVVFMNDDGRSW